MNGSVVFIATTGLESKLKLLGGISIEKFLKQFADINKVVAFEYKREFDSVPEDCVVYHGTPLMLATPSEYIEDVRNLGKHIMGLNSFDHFGCLIDTGGELYSFGNTEKYKILHKPRSITVLNKIKIQ